MSPRYHLDANVILRLLLADSPDQSPKARALFELAQAGKLTLFISHVMLAEVTWVLLSYYDFERGKVSVHFSRVSFSGKKSAAVWAETEAHESGEVR